MMLRKLYFSVDIQDLRRVLQILGSFQRQTFKDIFYDQDFCLLKKDIFFRKRREKCMVFQKISKDDDVISYRIQNEDLQFGDKKWDQYEIVTTRTTFDVYPFVHMDVCHLDQKKDFYYVFSTTISKEFLHSILPNITISYQCNPKFIEYLLTEQRCDFLKQHPTKFHVPFMSRIFPPPDCYVFKYKSEPNVEALRQWMEILREHSEESGSESSDNDTE